MSDKVVIWGLQPFYHSPTRQKENTKGNIRFVLADLVKNVSKYMAKCLF